MCKPLIIPILSMLLSGVSGRAASQPEAPDSVSAESIPVEAGEIVGSPVCEISYLPINGPADDFRASPAVALADTVWVHLAYSRFDVYIEEGYYSNNTPTIDDFFDLFETRFAQLEAITLWTSEESYGTKLRIYVTGWSGICYGGQFDDATATTYLRFSDPLYMDDPYLGNCKSFYVENEQWLTGNPGALGDFWRYMGIAVHEVTHAICPIPAGSNWLREGWAVYYEYNLLAMHGDINQETADYFIYNVAYPAWDNYVANDYRWPDDGSWQANHDIQHSNGYGPPAWMLSMLRNPDLSPDWAGTLAPLDWTALYHLWSHNHETFDKAVEIGGFGYDHYHSDIVIIDLLARVTGVDMYPIFRYDGPTGPGWGVRYWVSLDWYADLTPILSFSNLSPQPGQVFDLIADVYNNGQTDANGVSVRFYDGPTLLDAQSVAVAAGTCVIVTVPFSAAGGSHQITVRVDEDNLKLETDETNNGDGLDLYIPTCCVDRVGDANGLGGDEPTIGDVSVMIDAKFITGSCAGILDCMAEADVNQSGGLSATCDDVTVGDISTLIDYLFITGASLGLPDCL